MNMLKSTNLNNINLKNWRNWFFKSHPSLSFNNRNISLNKNHYLVCRAGVPDASELLAVEKRAFAGKTPWQKRIFQKELAHKKRTMFLVMRHNDEVVAYIAARFKRNNTCVHITNLAVLPEFRRQKLATTLMQILLDRAVKLGSVHAVLEVSVSNQAALALYRKMGFLKQAAAPNYYPAEHQDGLKMAKNLTTGGHHD